MDILAEQKVLRLINYRDLKLQMLVIMKSVMSTFLLNDVILLFIHLSYSYV